MFKKIIKNQAFKYLAVGGTSYLFEIGILFAVSTWMATGSAIAVTISFWLGLIFSFVLQRLITFQDKSKSARRLTKQSLQYIILVFVNYAFTLAFVTITDPIIGLLASRTIALVITTLWNYYIYKKIIFNDDKKIKKKTSVVSILRSDVFFISIATIPVIIFCIPMLSTGSALFPGDFDMQIQMTEATKITILEFGQMPLWNPWISGGVPLFSDPQFGLVTPQTILSFFINSVIAWKVTILLYLVAGFLSLVFLLRHITQRKHIVITILVSYLWIFGSFFTLRSVGGHFTFLLLALLPLAILFLLKSLSSKRYIIFLVLVIAFLLNAAIHYSTILTLITLGSVALMLTIFNIFAAIKNGLPNRKIPAYITLFKPLIIYGISAVAALILTSIRVLFTMHYLRSNSVERTDAPEPFIGLGEGLRSLFFPYGSYKSNATLTYGQFEASNYIGLITAIILVIFATAIVAYILRNKRGLSTLRSYKRFLVLFISVGLVFFVIGLGGFVFEVLRHLPVISSMRVSTRFFVVTTLCIITTLAILSIIIIDKRILGKYSKLIVYLLVLAASVQVFFVGFNFQIVNWVNNSSLLLVYKNESKETHPPHTDLDWKDQDSSTPYYHALTAATVAHRSQAVADNALVDTRSLPTQRCDEDTPGCAFILSKNAIVEYWSPNSMGLKRTGPGEIKLNMNQAKGWKINNLPLFMQQKTVNSNSTFTIPASNIDSYTLRYSLF